MVLVFPLLLDVLAEFLLIYSAIGLGEISRLPEAGAPEPNFQFREFFSDGFGCSTFQIHDCRGDCNVGWKLNHEMDMVWQYLTFMEKPLIHSATFVEQILQPLAHTVLQYTFSIFRREYNVVGQTMDRMTAFPLEGFFGFHSLILHQQWELANLLRPTFGGTPGRPFPQPKGWGLRPREVKERSSKFSAYFRTRSA